MRDLQNWQTMSEDVDFMILTRSLDRELARRGRVVHGLKRALSLVIPGIGLLVVAAFLVITNSVAVVITLSIVAMVIFELVRRGIEADVNTKAAGRRPGRPS
jgi:hypothetical protein